LQSYNLFFIPANFSAKKFVNPFSGALPEAAPFQKRVQS